MVIISIKFLDTEETTLLVNNKHSVPWPCHNEHRASIQKWLDDGNTIEPYVAPPGPTQQEQDLAVLREAGKDTAITVCGLIDALLAKGLIAPSDVDLPTRLAYQDLKAIADRVKA